MFPQHQPLCFSLLTLTVSLAVAVLVAQSCPALCNPTNCSLPGSSVHGILQASILDCHSLLQRIFLTQGSNPGLLHCRRVLYLLSYREDLTVSLGPTNRVFRVRGVWSSLTITKTSRRALREEESTLPSRGLGSPLFTHLFFLYICFLFFIWLPWVLVAARGSSLRQAGSPVLVHRLSSCEARASLPQGMWDLTSPTRDRTLNPGTARRMLNRWATREVPPCHF